MFLQMMFTFINALAGYTWKFSQGFFNASTAICNIINIISSSAAVAA